MDNKFSLTINNEWLKNNFLLFLDMDQVIFGYQYTRTGLTYGPLNEVIMGLDYLCKTYHGYVISLTDGRYKTKEAIRSYFDKHTPLWEFATHIYDYLPGNGNRAERIHAYFCSIWNDDVMALTNSSKNRVWIIDDSYSEYCANPWILERLLSRRDRLSPYDLAFMEARISEDPNFCPYSDMAIDIRGKLLGRRSI